MTGIIRNGQLANGLRKTIRRRYSVSTLPFSEEVFPAHQETRPNTHIPKTPTLGDKLKTMPSVRASKSYTASRGSSPRLSNDKSHKIKTQIIDLVERNQFDSLSKLLLSWAQHDPNAMLDVLGHHQFTEYMRLLISKKNFHLKSYSSLAPILRLINPKSRITQPAVVHSMTEAIRDIYGALIYTNPSIKFYDQERRHDIYATSELTGYKFTTTDYENLMHLEVMNRKLDLAAKWFRTFKREYPYDYVEKMTPKMWILVFQIYSGGNLHLWELKSTELASIRYDPKNSRFVDSINSNDLLADFRKSGLQVAEMGLEFHETLICSLGYEGKLSQLFNFIGSVWGVDKTGKIISDDIKLKPNDSKYPTMNTVISIFSSIAYNGHFFDAMKFVSEFQKSYEITGSNALDKRFFDSIFSWCDMSTKFEEDRALSYFLRQTNVKTNGTPTLNEISNDVNFDYEGFLEFVKKLKQERNQAFQQLWDIYQTDEIDFNHNIYSTYLNYLKEGIADNLEQKYYDYLSALLKQYHAYHTTSQSFNRRANLGFEPVNEKHQSVYILYQASMKELIDIKGKSLYIGQCQPLIDEWSLDTTMKQQLSDWFKYEKLNQFKRLREKKRQEFMMTLKKEDDEDDSLLNLM